MTADVQVPQKVQEALADVLKEQFDLGRLSCMMGQLSITRDNCMPMNIALKALAQEIRVALDDAAKKGADDFR
jgi:hypothetical protein